MHPYMEVLNSDTMKAVITSAADAMQQGVIFSFEAVEAHVSSKVLQQRTPVLEHSPWIFSDLCHTAAAIYAVRKIDWLAKIVCRSANRVVSQTWAEDVPSSDTDVRRHAGVMGTPLTTTSTSSLSSSPNIRMLDASPTTTNVYSATLPKSGRRKASQDKSLPSKCSQCPKVYSGRYRDDHLRRHIKIVHGTTSFRCKYCNKQLGPRTDNFTKHLRRMHPDKMSQENHEAGFVKCNDVVMVDAL